MIPRTAIAALGLAALATGCTAGPPPAPRPPAPAAAAADTGVPARDSVAQDSLGRHVLRVTSPELPPVPVRHGPLDLRVVYPAAGAVVVAGDSTFLFGSTGTGDARLTINGVDVPVWPNGAWLAWVAIPRDTLVRFVLEARTPTAATTLVHEVRRPPRFVPPPAASVWIDTTSFAPLGRIWAARDEYVELRVRAAEGVILRLRLPDGTSVPLVPDRRYEEVPEAIRAFDRDTANLRAPVRADRYVGLIRGRAIGPNPGPVLPYLPDTATLAGRAGAGCPAACPPGEGGRMGATRIPPPDSLWPVVEAIRGADTVRAVWRVQVGLMDTVPVVAELDDQVANPSTADGITVGRAAPGASYHWFLPAGTRARVTGRTNADLRLGLGDGTQVWVSAAEARLLPAGTPPPRARVGSLTMSPGTDRVTIRIPLGQRVAYRVSETERSIVLDLYDAVGDLDWMRYGPGDSLIERVQWSQGPANGVRLTVDLAEPVWGYRARWDRADLLLEIRRPPKLDESNPLAGLVIAVDPGHPPAGATGPTGLREAEANLAVSLRLAELLEDAGAEVRLTRTADVPMDLAARIRHADSVNAHLLVSIHNNALPDGVNPFTNNGSSVYYNHPRSLPLARAIQRELVRRLGLRDLGVGRGDLALARPTWMPAVLTEGLFMIVPDQEAALRSAEGQRRYALAVLDGMRQFLRERARAR